MMGIRSIIVLLLLHHYHPSHTTPKDHTKLIEDILPQMQMHFRVLMTKLPNEIMEIKSMG